jgi:hypothetical protein
MLLLLKMIELYDMQMQKVKLLKKLKLEMLFKLKAVYMLLLKKVLRELIIIKRLNNEVYF